MDGGLDEGNVIGITPDGLGSISLDDDGLTMFPLARVIDPATIPVIGNTPLAAATGTVGVPLTYDIGSTNAPTFTAAGLPGGLLIDSSTGAISGTPTVGGQFVATIKAASTVGVSDIETLTLTIAIPTAVGENVTVVPIVPEGQGPITVLSPFAVLVSDVVRKGFYAPINPIAGFLNTMKGGATVPLKFEVFVNGVEQTSTVGLATIVRTISCDTSAPEDPVEVEGAGGTELGSK